MLATGKGISPKKRSQREREHRCSTEDAVKTISERELSSQMKQRPSGAAMAWLLAAVVLLLSVRSPDRSLGDDAAIIRGLRAKLLGCRIVSRRLLLRIFAVQLGRRLGPGPDGRQSRAPRGCPSCGHWRFIIRDGQRRSREPGPVPARCWRGIRARGRRLHRQQ